YERSACPYSSFSRLYRSSLLSLDMSVVKQDETVARRGRLHKRESFAFVRGAVLLLGDGEREGPHDEATPSQFPNTQVGGGASYTKHSHLHAMISLLRPEDTVKLVRSGHQYAECVSKSWVYLSRKNNSNVCVFVY
ncbi:protein phosphatase Slingshot homolog 3 isoform X4, partial [Tachysurus ichikawai]